ncbi:MAG: hypothetical protein GXP49_10065 [Deltaproteobacteria bacterium]|nr:hypothetical protein [Deltaproteobacteria bacterium]
MARIRGFLLVAVIVIALAGGIWFLVKPPMAAQHESMIKESLRLAGVAMTMQLKADEASVLKASVEFSDAQILDEFLEDMTGEDQGKKEENKKKEKSSGSSRQGMVLKQKLADLEEKLQDNFNVSLGAIIGGKNNILFAYPHGNASLNSISSSNVVKSAFKGNASVGLVGRGESLFLVGAVPIWGDENVEQVAVQAMDLVLRSEVYSRMLGSDIYAYFVQKDRVIGRGGSSEAERELISSLGKSVGPQIASLFTGKPSSEPKFTPVLELGRGWRAVAGVILDKASSSNNRVSLVVLRKMGETGEIQVVKDAGRYILGAGAMALGLGAFLALLLLGGVDKKLKVQKSYLEATEPANQVEQGQPAFSGAGEAPNETPIPPNDELLEQLVPEREEDNLSSNGFDLKNTGDDKEPIESPPEEETMAREAADQEAETESGEGEEEAGHAEQKETEEETADNDTEEPEQEHEEVEPVHESIEQESGQEPEDEGLSKMNGEVPESTGHEDVEKELEELAASVGGDLAGDGWESMENEFPEGANPDELLEQLEKETTGEQEQPPKEQTNDVTESGELKGSGNNREEHEPDEQARDEKNRDDSEGEKDIPKHKTMPPPPPPKAMDATAGYDVETDTTIEQDNPVRSHFRKVFASYKSLRVECGESTEKLRFEKFAAKLQKNRDGLIKRIGCKDVRFSVYKKNGKAAIKATPIKS